ncbi:hypothetical protein AUEXF2481DRAFT_637091 [Aureobasidium subglaciale EXF-2481]|uniref:Uncharacterized protein n=1 Tax=Aureobasidium subglaciale (strain EXF-2481) TaxID=1043005 RepID=A0A074YK09_AURSE|nr:uncharacterized protein AUEXF2481DRAFT_637091 [Aureobasidium subglaciale EXF-2481]KEQ96419.1 hypothetical protein AUEXF2481DRAFT_637091 [Aureobasidium subglaciale EXF-2481]
MVSPAHIMARVSSACVDPTASFPRSLVLATALWIAAHGIADSYRRHWLRSLLFRRAFKRGTPSLTARHDLGSSRLESVCPERVITRDDPLLDYGLWQPVATRIRTSLHFNLPGNHAKCEFRAAYSSRSTRQFLRLVFGLKSSCTLL